MNPAVPAAPASTPARILVVDDEEIVVVALTETLRREGYQVLSLMDPATALDLLEREDFSVIISDQQMPRFTGLELLARARQLRPDALRILVTAVLNVDTIIDAVNKAEVFRFVVKPWTREDLLATVREAVQRHQRVRTGAQLKADAQAANARLLDLNRSLEQQLDQAAQQHQQLAQRNAALENNFQHALELCLRLIETTDAALAAQARRARVLCCHLAAALNLDAEERQTLDVAAALHTVGLLGLPRDLLQRWRDCPAGLTAAERARIEQYPVLSQDWIRFEHHLWEVGPTIRAHRERSDGQGYPDGLAGDAIPWLSRLLAVAVACADAREPQADPLEIVRAGSGTAFDPEAVRALLRSGPLPALQPPHFDQGAR